MGRRGSDGHGVCGICFFIEVQMLGHILLECSKSKIQIQVTKRTSFFSFLFINRVHQ